MSPLAHFLLATAVLHAACAASLPDAHSNPIPDFPFEELKDPLKVKEAAPVIAINDAEIDLHAKPEDIPVEVVIEDSQPAIKTNEVTDDDKEIKRPSVDLRNPGPPQRQEHETQNADHFSEKQQKLSIVQETILQTQDLLKNGVKGVGDDISNWLSTNEQMNTIQQNIQTLRENFTAQIQKLNEALQGLAPPKATHEVTPEQTQTKPDLNEVNTSIKVLEDNFNNVMRALSEGVNIAAILREEDSSTASAAPANPTPAPDATTPSSPFNVMQFFSNMQTNLLNSVTNLSNTIAIATSNVPVLNSFLNRTSTLPPNVQADTPEGTTQRPANQWQPTWPNFPQLFGGQPQEQEQQSQTSTTQGPIITGLLAIQNNFQNAFLSNPIVSSLLNRPGASASTEKPSEAPAGTNVVPEKPAGEKETQMPAAADTSAASPAAPPAPVGPIRQILSNSPVVQSIAGTVQRIQSTINNPEKPRDTEKSEDLQMKGGYGGSRPSGGASGDNNDVNSGLKLQNEDQIKEEPIKEVPSKVDPISEETKIPEVDKEIRPEVVLEKTE